MRFLFVLLLISVVFCSVIDAAEKTFLRSVRGAPASKKPAGKATTKAAPKPVPAPPAADIEEGDGDNFQDFE